MALRFSKMKKVNHVCKWLLALAAVSFYLPSSFATVSINWGNAAAAVVLNDGSTLLPQGSGIAQLIWVGEDNAIAEHSGLNGNNPLAALEDDVVVADLSNDDFSGIFVTGTTTVQAENFGKAPDTFVGSQFYVRVFDDVNPGAGDYYNISALSPVLPNADPPSNQSITWDFTGGRTFVLDMQIIPEPSSVALFSLGLVILRRRFSRDA